MNAPVTIRPFAAADLPAMLAITAEAFEPVSIDRNIERHAGGPIAGRDWTFRKLRQIEFDVDREPAGVFVAEDHGDVVGYITTFHDVDAGVGFIPNLAVAASHRAQGLGRRLIEHALEHFRKSGAHYVRIETLEQNAIGQSLYPSLGFEEICRQIHYGMRLG
jgi:ribosomal protein S18 acetylase RimI-like enzyme